MTHTDKHAYSQFQCDWIILLTCILNWISIENCKITRTLWLDEYLLHTRSQLFGFLYMKLTSLFYLTYSFNTSFHSQGSKRTKKLNYEHKTLWISLSVTPLQINMWLLKIQICLFANSLSLIICSGKSTNLESHL